MIGAEKLAVPKNIAMSCALKVRKVEPSEYPFRDCCPISIPLILFHVQTLLTRFLRAESELASSPIRSQQEPCFRRRISLWLQTTGSSEEE